MNSENIKIIKDVLFNEFGLDESDIKEETKLFQSGLLASIDMLQLTNLLEEKFNIKFQDDQIKMSNFESINLIAQMIEKISKN
ncbi:MAG: hypothetical protein KDK36_19915 [Leptospiraceae bacterium]|nr:hypothetical protein [Leptospiraceae bacterium]